jgi:hypothetical protein
MGFATMRDEEKEVVLACWDGVSKMCPSVIAKLLEPKPGRPRNDEGDDE